MGSRRVASPNRVQRRLQEKVRSGHDISITQPYGVLRLKTHYTHSHKGQAENGRQDKAWSIYLGLHKEDIESMSPKSRDCRTGGSDPQFTPSTFSLPRSREIRFRTRGVPFLGGHYLQIRNNPVNPKKGWRRGGHAASTRGPAARRRPRSRPKSFGDKCARCRASVRASSFTGASTD